MEDQIETFLSENEGWRIFIDETQGNLNNATRNLVSVSNAILRNRRITFDVKVNYNVFEEEHNTESRGVATIDRNGNITGVERIV